LIERKGKKEQKMDNVSHLIGNRPTSLTNWDVIRIVKFVC